MNPVLFDTHTHLTDRAFRSDRPAVLARARQAGVQFILDCGYDLETSAQALALAASEPDVFAAVGIHPHDARVLAGNEDRLAELAARPGVRAIGEIGLDFYRDRSPRPAQLTAFEFQLQLARQLNLPAVIHIRDAHDAAWPVLERVGPVRGVLHCYTGDAGFTARARDAGFFFGLGGTLTYHSDRARTLVDQLPLDAVLLETDCPYLAPVPVRGRRNEPAYLVHVNRFLAGLLGASELQVAQRTTANARRFLGL